METLTKTKKKGMLGDFYWAYADIIRGIGVPPATYDQRILAFMAVKLLIDNDKLKFNFDYKNHFGLTEKDYWTHKGSDTRETFLNLILNLENLSNKKNLKYFTQDAKFNPGESKNILAYINHPRVFPLENYINELTNEYLEMVLDIYMEKANFEDYPKEKYIDLYEKTVARMKSKFVGDLTGQHFTQKAIIHLMCEVAKKDIKPHDTIAIYDPACGTGSMIMESAHFFKENFPKSSIEVFGQEYNGQLWLLCKIFLEISSLDGKTQGIKNTIAYGNTLTKPAFSKGINGNDSFDFIIANPPFGVDWKQDFDEVAKNMESDDPNFLVVRDGKKLVTPKKSDGQFLFMLHIIKLMMEEKKKGKRAIAAIISSSTLISTGSKTSSEAKIRQRIFEEKLVRAVIEQPGAMFTNTEINSLIWFLDTEESQSIRIIKVDNEEEALFSPHPQPQDKMRNTYNSGKDIPRILKLLSRKTTQKFITKDLNPTARTGINMSSDIGKKDQNLNVDLDVLENEINKLLKKLTEIGLFK